MAKTGRIGTSPPRRATKRETRAPTPAPEADDLRAKLAALPKVELHRHLEGSLRLSTLVELAKQYQLDVPAYDLEGLRSHVQIMPGAPATIEHFLSKFSTLRQFYCAPDVIRRFVREAVEDAAADNVKYMELRFTPKALAKLKHFAFAEVIKWVCQAAQEAQEANDIIVRLIVSPNRHESALEGQQAIEAAIDMRSRGIVGVDLCGQENGYPANPFAGILAEARQSGMHVTIHAGEWAGPHNVRYAIEHLGATRIGHGVRVLEDHPTVRLAQEAGTYFEVCPTSNIQSGVVRAIEQHPLPDMRYLNLNTTINTDDPSVSNITLTDELYLAMKALGFGLDDVKKNILNAVHSAFLPDAERAKLVAYFTQALGLSGSPSSNGTGELA
jgi:adenosine deaminase